MPKKKPHYYSKTYYQLDLCFALDRVKAAEREKAALALELSDTVKWSIEAKAAWIEALKTKPARPTDEQKEALKKIKGNRFCARRHVAKVQEKHERALGALKRAQEWLAVCQFRIEQKL